HEVESSLRATKQGLFVHEDLVVKLIEVYKKWLKEVAGSDVSEDKCIRKLFGDDESKLYYVLDRNRCLPGYLLQGAIAEPQKLRIPYYQANLLDPVINLHPKDPYVSKIDKANIKLTTHQGLLFEFEIRGVKLEANENFIREFSDVIRNSRGFSRSYPQVSKALRYVFDPLLRFLEKAQFVPFKEPMLIPEAFIDKRNITYYRSQGVVFVVEDECKLLSCYELKGRGVGRFVDREISYLVKNFGPICVRKFDFEKPKAACLGKIWIKGISLHLHRRAFDLYLQQIRRSHNLRDKLSNRFSFRQVLERFVGVFIHAQHVEEREILQVLRRNRMQMAKYRRVGKWIFIIVDKNVIYSCFAVRG
ncbi:MAG: hypothetical protein KBC84_09900, partial [Proteobacteria bacterium]|nr:hypothetical protein [Pseudomonadota bacterium]